MASGRGGKQELRALHQFHQRLGPLLQAGHGAYQLGHHGLVNLRQHGLATLGMGQEINELCQQTCVIGRMTDIVAVEILELGEIEARCALANRLRG